MRAANSRWRFELSSRFWVCLLVLGAIQSASAQVYVLKDHRDTVHPQHLFDTLPELCDSFFIHLQASNPTAIKKFVPDVDFLKTTYDTLNVEYNEANAIYRQQMVQRSLEMQYKRLLKQAEKQDINLKRLELKDSELKYGVDEDGNEFCFVTLHCARNKREYQVSFIAIKLNGKWFMGDELKLKRG